MKIKSMNLGENEERTQEEVFTEALHATGGVLLKFLRPYIKSVGFFFGLYLIFKTI